MHTWTVQSEVCRACEVLEATRDNDAESGRKYGMKYATGRRNG